MNVTENECNFQLERTVRKLLHTLEELFKEHYLLFQSTVEEQKDILDGMWVVSQRFLILTRGALCVRPYPREPTDREERELTAEFHEKKQNLQSCNNKLSASLCHVKEKSGAFDRAMRDVDVSLPNKIVDGDETRQPIYYYIELFGDLYKFFHQIQNKLNLLGRFLMVDDIGSILEYKHLLEPDRVVNEYFEKCLNIVKKSEK